MRNNNKKACPPFRQGFTLLELILVIAIISIMTAVGLALSTKLRTSKKVESAKREVVSVIRLTQNNALQGKTVSGSTPCGFGFRFTSQTEYEVYYVPLVSGSFSDCDEQNENQSMRYCGGNCQVLETFSLETGVIMSSNNDDAQAYFSIPHGNVFSSNGTALSSTEFTLEDEGGSKQEDISINFSGSVQ